MKLAVLPAALAAAGVIASACATRDSGHGDRRPPPAAVRETDPAPRAPKESRVFDVKSSNDLLSLNSEYARLWESGFDGTLEVNVGAGPFTPIGWDLRPSTPSGQARIDVVIRGGGAVFPFPGHVQARSLRLENLVLTGTRSGPTEIRVSTDFTMKRSMLVDGRFADPNFAGGYLEVFADGGKKVAAQATIEDCWFVRNFQTKAPMQMVSLLQRGEDAGYFERVRVRHSAFLGNAFAADLAVDFATSVAIEDSLFYRNWPTGSELRLTSCGAVTVERSTFAVEKIDQVAAVDASPPVLVRGSRILVRDWKAGGKPPPALSVSAGQIADRAAVGSADGVVAEVITALTTQPFKMPSPEVWQRVEAAFGSPR